MMLDALESLARNLAHAMPKAGDWQQFENYVSTIKHVIQAVLAEQRGKDAEIARRIANIAKEHKMFPAYGLNAIAEAADEVGDAILAQEGGDHIGNRCSHGMDYLSCSICNSG